MAKAENLKHNGFSILPLKIVVYQGPQFYVSNVAVIVDFELDPPVFNLNKTYFY